VAALQRQFAPLAQISGLEGRAVAYKKLHGTVGLLLTSAAEEGLRDVVGEATALAAFLEQLSDKPAQVTDSSLRTLSLAFDALALLARAPGAMPAQVTQSLAVVVDSQHVSRTVTCNAMRNAELAPMDFNDAEEALRFLQSHAADLVVLDAATAAKAAKADIDLYRRVKRLPLHQRTPVIVVSNPSAGRLPEGSPANGETQVLAKPYSMVHYLELALKARSIVLKHRLANLPGASDVIGPDRSNATSAPDLGESLSRLEETHAALRNAHSPRETQGKQPRTTPEQEAQQREEIEKVLADLRATPLPSATGSAEPDQPEPKVARGLDTGHPVEPSHDAATPAGGPNAVEAKLEIEQHAVMQLKKRVDELQMLLQKRDDELARAESGAPTPRGIWAVLSRRGKQQATPADSPPAELYSKEMELESRCRQLEQELAAVRQGRDELQAKLTAQAQTAAEAKPGSDQPPPAAGATPTKSDVSEEHRQVRESVALRARATAELEQERGERRRVEQRVGSLTKQLQELHEQLKLHLESESVAQNRTAELENVLREREEELSRTTAELQRESTERKMAEDQLRTTSTFSAQLRNCLSSFDAAKQAFKRSQEQAESRLQASQKTLSESEARLQKAIHERQRLEQALAEGESRLQKETGERQRLEEAVATAQRSLSEQTQRNQMEICRLQSELEVEQAERKRLEGDALQLRYDSLDSARVGVSLVNKLRTRMQAPLDTLVQTTRRLLEVQLEAGPKKLVEASFEHALLLQTVLQESAGLNDAKAEAGGTVQPGHTGSSPDAVAA
jgi:hypothetical protein